MSAESALPLDIRKLHREKLLNPGTRITSTWSTGGNVHSRISATAFDDCLVLDYSHNGEPVKQTISFSWTQCNYGGKRIWFCCPFCGRRCAIIYGAGKYFGCRVCYNLTYESCNENKRDRRFSKADRLRRKIGAKPGAFNPLPLFKPKGMHYKTWMRIRNQIQHLESIGFAELAMMLGR